MDVASMEDWPAPTDGLEPKGHELEGVDGIPGTGWTGEEGWKVWKI